VRATLQTIADELGVSRSTVSNAYSRPDQLSPQLRARVLAVAERLGYPGPNPTARSLRRGRAGAIGVLFTADLAVAFTDPFAVAYLRGLAEVAAGRDTSLLLIPLSSDGGEAAVRAVRDAVVDAFCVYCVPAWHKAVDVVRARGLPVVGGEDPALLGPEGRHVGIDERGAARGIAEHVIRFGHRRLAIVADWVTEPGRTHVATGVTADDPLYYVTRERLRGFRDAFTAAGVAWADVIVINAAGNDRARGAEAAGLALDRAARPTAILATSDVMALGVLDALATRGLRAGRDVSVTGFDDIPEAVAAGLTTIHQPSDEKGRIAGHLILDPPADPAARHRVLPTSLVVRATTGPAPQPGNPGPAPQPGNPGTPP
jgi:DNA-binding LacI/PurR family transcriptional regulator